MSAIEPGLSTSSSSESNSNSNSRNNGNSVEYSASVCPSLVSMHADAGEFLCDFDLNICNEDLKEIYAELIEDARKKHGIKYYVVPGSNLIDSKEAIDASLEFRSKRDNSLSDIHILATCGVHPYHAPQIPLNPDTLSQVERLVSHSSCLAVGECGLDYSSGIIASIKDELGKIIGKDGPVNGFTSKDDISDAKLIEIQKSWFREQLDLAIRCDKPVYLHVRDAQTDFVEIMSSYPQIVTPSSSLLSSPSILISAASTPSTTPPLPPAATSSEKSATTSTSSHKVSAVIHCFTGSTDELRQYLDMGFLIGLTGHIFRLKDKELKTWLDMITLNRLVLETDAPWMGFKNCTSLCQITADRKAAKLKAPANVPSSLRLIVDRVSKVSGWSSGDVIRATTLNALKFLRYI